jgi:hypothetical protein
MWEEYEEFHYLPPKSKDRFGQEEDPHDVLWQAVQKYDDDMCKAWKEDSIDTLLVFVCAITTSTFFILIALSSIGRFIFSYCHCLHRPVFIGTSVGWRQ